MLPHSFCFLIFSFKNIPVRFHVNLEKYFMLMCGLIITLYTQISYLLFLVPVIEWALYNHFCPVDVESSFPVL